MPAISGAALWITPARAGLLRAGAGRSGAPILAGVIVPLYALSGVGRSGAMRSNYHSGKRFLTLAGTIYGETATLRAHPLAPGILDDSVTVNDTLDDVPNQATLRIVGAAPAVGQELIIRLGSINNTVREFAGTVLRTNHEGLGSDPQNDIYTLSLIDYTWGLNTRKVSGYYTGSGSTILASLISTYAPGYTAVIEAGLPVLSGGITFTNQDLTACLTQTCKRLGITWRCDYDRVVRAPARNAADTPPTILNRVHPSLDNFKHERDLSQVVTRCYVEGGGVAALATCAVGETILPLAGDPIWYDPAGGTVVSGPQRIAYTGVSMSAGGGLVGTGASPSGAPVVALATGVGIESGAHSYGVTFVTAAGESIVSPLATITPGLTDAPASAPTAGTPTPGTGPNPGTHEYAVTFVTASGETTPSPVVATATGVTDDPTVAPTGAAAAGAGIEDGTHEYAVTFVTAIGETAPSPISGGVLTGPVATSTLAAPTTAPTPGTPTAGAGLEQGTHDYVTTFVIATGETTPGPISASVTITPVAAPTWTPAISTNAGLQAWSFSGPQIAIGDAIAIAIAFVTASGVTTIGPVSNTVTAVANTLNPGHASVFPFTFPATTTPGVTAARVYVSRNGTWIGYLESTGYIQTFDAGVEAIGCGATGSPPSTNTAGVGAGVVPLTAIPTTTGSPAATSRKLYRRFNGTGTFKLVANIAGNSTTTYSDSTPNSGLGVDAPTTNTAAINTAYNRVALTAIPTGASGVGVTDRKLYRRSAGLGLKLLATIANNSSTTYTDSTPNASLGAAAPVTTTAYVQRIPLTAIPVSASALVLSKNVYGTVAGGSQLKLIANIAANATTYTVVTPDSGLGANAPVTNTATANQVAVSGIPIGAAAVTARKLWRTVAGGAQLKLLTTIANNTTTTYADSTPDASLGANVPTVDTSGLAQPQGMVLAGSTSLVVASIGSFPPAGWAVIGNGQLAIRYTGVAGNVLTGIPASGPGSIEASIAFNSTVTSAPVLTGIPASGAGSILYPVLKGSDVNIWITVNDTAAQATLAALLGTDGIQEAYIQDRRLAKAEATARGVATLALSSAVAEAITYTCRDLNTRTGQLIDVNLGPPYNVTASFLIQSVTQTFVPAAGRLLPLYQVQASSRRLTFEQLLKGVD